MRYVISYFVMSIMLLTGCSKQAPSPSATPPQPEVQPILLGDITSYTSAPSVAEPIRHGMILAIEEINAAGGVLGRPLEVISRDPQGNPADATRHAIELIERDNVDVLIGTLMDNVKMAVSDVSKQYKVPFFCSSSGTDRLIVDNGHPYVFRTGERFPNLMHALTKELIDSHQEKPLDRWVTIAPTMEYGQAMVSDLKVALAQLQPNAEIIFEQWYPMGKMDAAAVTQTLRKLKPDVIMSGVLGSDLPEFIRQGRQRGVLDQVVVMAPYVGVPGWLSVLGDETPEGWLTNGYPADEIDTPEHRGFVAKFEQRFPNEQLRIGALHSYITVHAVAAAIEKAGNVNSDDIARAGHGLEIETPIGPVRYHPELGQSDFGAWIGYTTVVEGKPKIRDWYYAPSNF